MRGEAESGVLPSGRGGAEESARGQWPALRLGELLVADAAASSLGALPALSTFVDSWRPDASTGVCPG